MYTRSISVPKGQQKAPPGRRTGGFPTARSHDKCAINAMLGPQTLKIEKEISDSSTVGF